MTDPRDRPGLHLPCQQSVHFTAQRREAYLTGRIKVVARSWFNATTLFSLFTNTHRFSLRVSPKKNTTIRFLRSKHWFQKHVFLLLYLHIYQGNANMCWVNIVRLMRPTGGNVHLTSVNSIMLADLVLLFSRKSTWCIFTLCILPFVFVRFKVELLTFQR